MNFALFALPLVVALTGLYVMTRKLEPVPVRIRNKAGRRTRHH